MGDNVIWSDRMLRLLDGPVNDILQFLDDNGPALQSWQHGFCSRLLTAAPHNVCKVLLRKLAAVCPVDEVIFDLVDVSNDHDHVVFYDIILPSYFILLTREPNSKYLDWYIGMIKNRLNILIIEEDSSTRNSYIEKSFDDVKAAVILFRPLNTKVRSLLCAELLKYWIEDGKEIINVYASRALRDVLPEPFFLIEALETRLNEEKPSKAYNPILDDSVVTFKTVCLYFGARVLNSDFPLVYSPQYLFTSTLAVVCWLLVNNDDDIINLGIKLISYFLSANQEKKFEIHDLTPNFRKTMHSLNNILIFNQSKQLRDDAFRLFDCMLDSFDDKGIYYFLLNYRKDVNHSSTISFLLSKIKARFIQNYPYFQGKLFFDILKVYASLKNDTDLLSEHTQIGLCWGQRRQCSSSNTEDKRDEREDEYEDNIRHRILQASLPLVKEYGWTQQTIAEGAKKLGYPGVTSGIFQNGAAADLIFYFYVDCNRKLVTQLETDAALAKEKQEPREIVEAAIQARLKMIIPYLDSWPQALGIMTMPRNVPIALSHLLTLVDDICYHTGDRSVDFNWYSRRLAVGGIYKMTELCLIQDKSENFSATWDFLHRRMDEAMNVHSLLQSSGEATNVARDTILATFTTARNILRLNEPR